MLELKENKGLFFRNEQKKGEKHPDYQGEIDVNGVKFRLSGWINESKSGKKYMSLSIKETEPRNLPEDYKEPKDKPDTDLPF